MSPQQEPANLHRPLIEELEDFAVLLVSLDGRIISWNPGVERFFGYTENNFVGRNLQDIFTPEDRAAGAPEKEIKKARQEGRTSDVRWHICSDQSRVFLEGLLLGVKDAPVEACSF